MPLKDKNDRIVFDFTKGFGIGMMLGLIVCLAGTPAQAYPVDHEGNPIIPIHLLETCNAKGDVTGFTYDNRDKFPENNMLDRLRRDWKETWYPNPNIKHHTYVDMQRIVRDAYRTDSEGNYMRDCCTEDITQEQINNELETCFNVIKY